MREPRSKQRFPDGGKGLYELLRTDHEPVMVFVYPSDEVSLARSRLPDTLIFERNFDPMVYFWPVEGQHVLADFLQKPADPDKKRLVKALERDGAAWITVMWRDERKLQWEHFGDADLFIRKWGDTLDPVAFPG